MNECSEGKKQLFTLQLGLTYDLLEVQHLTTLKWLEAQISFNLKHY